MTETLKLDLNRLDRVSNDHIRERVEICELWKIVKVKEVVLIS